MDSLPNEPQHYVIKLYVLFCYFGALRTCEAVGLRFTDVSESKEGLLVSIVRTKTDKAGLGQTILIPNDSNSLRCARDIFNLYSSSISNKGRIWLKWSPSSQKFLNQPIGKNLLSKYANSVAIQLGKPNPENYTGHCFRVSAATALADAGASNLNLKRHGGWKSDSVAESYLRDSKKMKMEIANLLSGQQPTEQLNASSGAFIFHNCVFNSCSLNPPVGSPKK